MKKSLLLSLLLLTTAALAESKVKIAVGLTPAGSFDAVSEKLKGDIFKTGGNFTADKLWISVESFKTGIELRDEHFWKHLNSTKFSKVVLSEIKGSGGKATGVLEVNGVKKPVNIAYNEGSGHISASFLVRTSDYGLAQAKYLGVGVNDEIKIEATHPFKNK